MRRIGGVFEKVEPIVIGVAHRLDLALAAAVEQRRVIGQRRRIIAIRSHVGKDQSAQLTHRIGQDASPSGRTCCPWAPPASPNIVRERRTASHDTDNAIPPSSISPYSNDVPRCGQCSPSKPNLAVGIAKQHQLFAKNFDRLRNIVEIASVADDQPVAAKPFTRRRARPHVRNIGERNFLVASFDYFRPCHDNFDF